MTDETFLFNVPKGQDVTKDWLFIQAGATIASLRKENAQQAAYIDQLEDGMRTIIKITDGYLEGTMREQSIRDAKEIIAQAKSYLKQKI